VETEAKAVRMVFEIYTQQRLSINAIARLLNERRIATRRAKADGNDPRFGACCAILRIGEPLAMENRAAASATHHAPAPPAESLAESRRWRA
jgi:hypothetical protein